jgi:hypothetical protein
MPYAEIRGGTADAGIDQFHHEQRAGPSGRTTSPITSIRSPDLPLEATGTSPRCVCSTETAVEHDKSLTLGSNG